MQREAGKHGQPRDVPWVCFLLHSTHTFTITTFMLISGVYANFRFFSRFGSNSSEAKSALVLLFAFLHFCTNETIVITEDVFFESVNPINGRGGEVFWRC